MASAALLVAVGAKAAPTATEDATGAARVIVLAVPPSRYASPEARAKLAAHSHSGPLTQPPPKDGGIPALRAYFTQYNDALAARMQVLYPVDIKHVALGGVSTEVITPKGGPSTSNAHRVLINLHGGAFMWGDGSGGEVEAIPVAFRGGFTVVAVNYRLAPEFKFPAASEDVAAVYRTLLRDHEPGEIGLYGCSAGGILTAQAIAWFDKAGLPQPGAIGTFCGSAAQFSGDSINIAPAVNGEARPEGQEMRQPYLAGADARDPLVFPANSFTLMAKFPPTLLIAGSRDYSVSSLFYTQRLLTNAGVEAELHVWDGLGHAFFMNPDLPESREVYDVIVRFFDRHLTR